MGQDYGCLHVRFIFLFYFHYLLKYFSQPACHHRREVLRPSNRWVLKVSSRLEQLGCHLMKETFQVRLIVFPLPRQRGAQIRQVPHIKSGRQKPITVTIISLNCSQCGSAYTANSRRGRANSGSEAPDVIHRAGSCVRWISSAKWLLPLLIDRVYSGTMVILFFIQWSHGQTFILLERSLFFLSWREFSKACIFICIPCASRKRQHPIWRRSLWENCREPVWSHQTCHESSD